MTRQPNLFCAFTATIISRQGTLFEGQPVIAHGLHCDQCEQELIETESYLICPECLGRLIPDIEPNGSWFDDDLTSTL